VDIFFFFQTMKKLMFAAIFREVVNTLTDVL